MRTASILLALVVVLGFVSEAGSDVLVYECCDRCLEVGVHDFGFVDWSESESGPRAWTTMYLGPYAHYNVPFTATQGLLGFCVIVVWMLALVTMGTFRWKRRAKT